MLIDIIRGDKAMTIISYLKRSAELYPDKTAFEDAEKKISFSELLKCAGIIATQINKITNSVNKPVAVMIDRNIESICAFMGIAMSRNFYVPVDVSLPPKRIENILNQMQPEAVISIGNNFDKFKELADCRICEYEELIKDKADDQLLEMLDSEAKDTDPLYAICTSGSTGVPKGVLISHRSVMDFIPVFCDTFGMTKDDIFGNQAPFDFDVSVKDIYSTLYLGASMYIIPRICFVMAKMLLDRLVEKKITAIVWAVSALCIVAELNLFEYKIPDNIKKVLFSGEVMPVKMLNIWMKNVPDAMYVNLYGPTEITCNCMYYIIDKEYSDTDKLPLGKPFRNEKVLLLNDQDLSAKAGEEGEICVGGTCLALGYYNNMERTAESFVQNPLNKSYPEIMYRTGDMAVIGEDGEWYFNARRDFQIKHMGHRIELEEVEMYITSLDGVSRASCLFDEEGSKLVAFYSGTLTNKDIIRELKQMLPKYMIPNVFIQQDKMPLNKNGKIDRQKLKDIYFS